MDVKSVKFIEPLVKPEDELMKAEETGSADEGILSDDAPETATDFDSEPTLF